MSKYIDLEKQLGRLQRKLSEKNKAHNYAQETLAGLRSYQHNSVSIEVAGLNFPISKAKAIELVEGEVNCAFDELEDLYQQIHKAMEGFNVR